MNSDLPPLTVEQIRRLSMSFLLGVAIGELFNAGLSEHEIREAIERAIDNWHATRAKTPKA